MISSIQSKFFTRLLSGLSLMCMFLLLPHNAKAQTAIPGTGVIDSNCPNINPNNPSGFGCKDVNYQQAIPCPLCRIFLEKTDLSGTSPGFLAAPAGPSGAFWIARSGDVQFGSTVNDWRVTFSLLSAGNITVSGTMAAEGSVAVALNGLGNFAGPQSLTSLGNFSVTEAGVAGTNTLDFIFTGCISFPSCGSNGDPVGGLLVDPSWSPALPGTPLDTIPESVLFADAGVAPSSLTPEPSSLLLYGTGLLGVVGAARRKWRA